MAAPAFAFTNSNELSAMSYLHAALFYGSIPLAEIEDVIGGHDSDVREVQR
jgi:hypothetical protein